LHSNHPNRKPSLAVIKKKAAVKTTACRQADLTTAFFPLWNLLVFRIAPGLGVPDVEHPVSGRAFK
jgi:hypothetical protein